MDVVKRMGTGAVRMISSAGSKVMGKSTPEYNATEISPRQEEIMERARERQRQENVESARMETRQIRREQIPFRRQPTYRVPARRMSMQEYEERQSNAQAAANAIRIAKAEMRAERFARLKQEIQGKGNVGRFSQNVQSRVEGVARGFSQYGTGKSGGGQSYALAGARTKQGRYSAYKVGRPKGPSGRYIIPGVGPVGVYQYRDWMKRQRAMLRQKQEQEMMNPQQQLRQARDYPSYPQQPQQYVQEYVPQPQVPQQMPLPPRPSPLGRLNLWDSGFSMTGGDMGLITPFGQQDEVTGTGRLGLFTPFGGGIL